MPNRNSRKVSHLGLVIVLALPVSAANAQKAQAIDDTALMKQAQGISAPIPTEPPKLEGNPLTLEKVELGRMLWFEPRLSSSQILSCNSCHNLAIGGDDNQETSIGHGWQAGPRNSPTVFNAVFNAAQFWDGRAEDLKEQAKGPIQASVEMNNHPERVLETLQSMPEYVERFKYAFPDDKSPLSFDNVTRAIEAFEATLLTPNSLFDRYLAGDVKALNEQQKRGLQTFMNSGCAACHGGVNLGGQQYFPFGVVERPGSDILPRNDKGRFAVTNTVTDEYVFRAVPLRNVALTPPYFHSGKVWDLGQAVGIMGVAQLGRELNEQEIEDIVAFLWTLNGEKPVIEIPQLPPRTDKTPLPVVAAPVPAASAAPADQAQLNAPPAN